MSNISNNTRILEELVSVEAWHKPLEFDSASPFHVALSFGDARYSGGDKGTIEFRVRLKRATLVVICDDSITVPQATKVREHPQWEMTIRQVMGQCQSSGNTMTGSFNGKVSADTVRGPIGNFSAERKTSRTENRTFQGEREITQKINQYIKMNYRVVGGEHHWDCFPEGTETLSGSAHDGRNAIMELKPNIDQRLEDLGIRVFVKCRADDFDITELTIKKSLRELLTGEDLERRKKLAHEVIKHKLAEADLEIVEIEPRFQEVIIADILAIPE